MSELAVQARLPRLTRLLALLSAIYGLGLLVYLLLRLALRDSLWWLALLNNFTPYYFLPLLVLIPLLVILRARAMALRLLPLLLVGLLMYGPRWLPRTPAPADGDTLKLVTFNVLILTDEFSTQSAWLQSTGADLILLQEAGNLDPETDFASLDAAYPYLVDLTGTTVYMLSRYPVNNAQTVDLGAWFIDRVEVETNMGPLAVYNVHMDWPIQHPMDSNFPAVDAGGTTLDLVLRYGETNRNALIRRFLEIVQDEPLPYIAAGDFNTSDNSPIYDTMAAVMHDSFRETSTGLGATWPAALGDDPVPDIIPPLLRLDYVWHGEGLRAVSTEIGPKLGSDHLPVVAVLAQNS